jgi:hypothetical protein
LRLRGHGLDRHAKLEAVRRAAIVIACVLIAWTILLLVLDVALEGAQQRRVEQRVGESLQATAKVGDADLALGRGRLRLEQLSVRRDDAVGKLALDVAEVRCELLPLGIALADHDCRELAIEGMRLEVSTAAVFKLAHPARRPIHANRVVIDDAELAFAPSAFAPSLGRIAVRIEHAEAGPTVFRTPLSWLFALEVLRARIDLPANITLRLAYANGRLAAAGTLFGSATVEVPFTPPAADAATDARDEIRLLVKAGEDVAEQLVAKRAEDWLRSKLH